MKDKVEWKKAIVTRKKSKPRSYEVMTQTGKTYRRNRRDLRSTKEDYSPINPNFDANVPTKETTIDANIEPPQDPGQRQPLVTTRSERTVKQPSHLTDFVT